MALKILDNWNVKINECVYIGDSPNDSPMFKKFPLSVGVKSVLDYSDFMKDYPSYVTGRDGNQGFEELVNSILSTKSFPFDFDNFRFYLNTTHQQA